jgi:uncharacterized membrane protein
MRVRHRVTVAVGRVLFAAIVVWLLERGTAVVHHPGAFDAWDSWAETVALLAGAWALCDWGVRIPRILFGLALIAFGLAHFIYFKETAALVPRWLPWHAGWAAFTGAAFLAAALSVITGILAQWAAVLVTLELGVFTVLVWLPVIVAGSPNAFERSEFAISCALTAAAWVVAESYRTQRPR